MQTVVKQLTSYLRGWKQYFGLCQVSRARRDLDGWIRRRLRLLQGKQWKRGKTAYSRLVAMGAKEAAAVHTAQHLRRWWYAANSPRIQQAPATYFDQLGLLRLG